MDTNQSIAGLTKADFLERIPVMETLAKDIIRLSDQAISEEDYKTLFTKYQIQLLNALRTILDLWDSREYPLGHDRWHVAYDLLETLYLAKMVDIPISQMIPTLFGGALHDLGRGPELWLEERSGAMDFTKKMEVYLHAALSGILCQKLLLPLFANESNPFLKAVADAFQRRLLGAVLWHGGKNIDDDVVGHHVQSCDRLAGILGSRQLVRVLITDVLSRGAAVYPDENLDYSHDFPRFQNLPWEKFQDADTPRDSWTNGLHYLVMPMRNIYPLSTELATTRAAEMRRQSGLIITALCGGKGTNLWRQVFAPDLSEYKSKFGFPQKPLPVEIWQAIQGGPTSEEKVAMQPYSGWHLEALTGRLLDQQTPDITDIDRDRLHQILRQGVRSSHQEHVCRAIRYTVARRQLDRNMEREFLRKCLSDPDPFVSLIGERLLENELWA